MLLPLRLRDWLDDNHVAWFVIDAVTELDPLGLPTLPRRRRALHAVTPDCRSLSPRFSLRREPHSQR
jgi:hypothetical protein